MKSDKEIIKKVREYEYAEIGRLTSSASIELAINLTRKSEREQILKEIEEMKDTVTIIGVERQDKIAVIKSILLIFNNNSGENK